MRVACLAPAANSTLGRSDSARCSLRRAAAGRLADAHNVAARRSAEQVLRRLPALPQLDPSAPSPGPGEVPTYLPPWAAPPPAPRKQGRPRKDGSSAPPFVVEEGPDGYRDVHLPLVKAQAQQKALAAAAGAVIGALISALPFWRRGPEWIEAQRRLHREAVAAAEDGDVRRLCQALEQLDAVLLDCGLILHALLWRARGSPRAALDRVPPLALRGGAARVSSLL